jgi:AcrR family transcriptional regulator
MPVKAARKLGRPPATSSVETRQRIVDVARKLFAEVGWEVTTNKLVAAKAGVTSAAIYHYFDSKLDMYLAVYDDVAALVNESFAAVMASCETFVAQFEAVLEEAHRMNAEDPTLARFLGSARVDIARHPEILKGMRRRRRTGDDIVLRLVDTGIATGEIRSADRAAATAAVRLILVGLNDAVSDDLEVHRAAIDAMRALVEGRLIAPPSAANGGPRRRKSRN